MLSRVLSKYIVVFEPLNHESITEQLFRVCLYWHFGNFNVYISDSAISSYQECNKVYIGRILDVINIAVEAR